MGRTLFLGAIAALLATSCLGVARELLFESIDMAGANSVSATDIDDRGRILGGFSVPGRRLIRGFLIAHRDTTIIEVADSRWTSAGGFNARTQIVGTYRDAAGEPHGYLLDDSALTEIEFPGASGTSPTDINNRGTIVGGYSIAGNVHGFILEHGRYTTIDVPGAQTTHALGINDRGSVVGDWKDDEHVSHGYVLRNGTFTHLDVPGAIHGTSAKGINASGKVVGNYIDATGLHGFIWERGVFTTVDFPGALETSPVAINNRGDIVGEYQDAARRLHGFVAWETLRRRAPKHPTLPQATELASRR